MTLRMERLAARLRARETVNEEDSVRLEISTHTSAFLLRQAQKNEEVRGIAHKSEAIEVVGHVWYWRDTEFLGRSRPELCPVLVGSSFRNTWLHEDTPVLVAR